MRELILQLRGRGGDPHDELGSLHRLAVDSNAAPVRFHDALHQVQAQTCAVYLVLNGAPPTEERIENSLLLVERDARAMVGDPNLDCGAAFARYGRGGHADP